MRNGRRVKGQQAGSGLAVRNRLIRYQPGRARPPIPGGITPEDFLKITRTLRDILQDIDKKLKSAPHGPKEIHVRLNESDKPFPFPVFAGWVEAEDVRQTRQQWNHPDPGLHRFGDDVYSEIYGEAFRYANQKGNHFRYRDWEEGEILEKRSGEKATDPKAGNRFQTCLAIVIGERCAGTLVVGFRKKPPQKLLTTAQTILREWAREDFTTPRRGRLIKFLKRFDLGGPRLQRSDWVKQI